MVRIEDAAGTAITGATSDATGGFRFAGLKPGRYVLTAENPGTNRVGRGDVVVRAGRETVTDIELSL